MFATQCEARAGVVGMLLHDYPVLQSKVQAFLSATILPAIDTACPGMDVAASLESAAQ